MTTKHITIRSEKDLYHKEVELKQEGYKRTFNSISSQIWEQGKHDKHKMIVLELEYQLKTIAEWNG